MIVYSSGEQADPAALGFAFAARKLRVEERV
jgi:hypothetical protein